MCSVIIVHILESIFVFVEVQLVSYTIYLNVLVIVDMVFSSLYNDFASHIETSNDSLQLSPLNLS